MAVRRTAQLLMSGLLLAGAIGVLELGTLLAFHVTRADLVAAWLLAWSLLFTMVLPGATLVLLATQLFSRYVSLRTTVPRAGLTVPVEGQ
jgi:ABC-type Fe3+ transport system permease subunit